MRDGRSLDQVAAATRVPPALLRELFRYDERRGGVVERNAGRPLPADRFGGGVLWAGVGRPRP